MLSREQEIRVELEAHKADLREEFLRSGLSSEAAEQQVNQAFGDMDSILKETLALQPSRSLPHPLTLLLIMSILFSFFISFIFFVLLGEQGQLALEKPLIWSLFFSLTLLALSLHKIIFEYIGFKTAKTATISLVVSLLMSFAGTALLDLNNFEVTIHLIGLAILLGIGLHVWWSRIPLKLKSLSLYLFSVLASFSAFTERPLFSFLGELRCLFIEQSTVPLTGGLATCEQLPLWHPLLILLYVLVIGGGIYVAFFLLGFFRNSATNRIKKWILAVSFSFMSAAPLILPDLNRYGEMDIIPWKIEIYQAYSEILGRNPEQKDIEFYAQSRAYLNMLHLKEVLYQSEERKLKIDLLYQEILHRHASSEELDFLVDQQWSVDQIREFLQTQ